jgi:ribonuclease P protein component
MKKIYRLKSKSEIDRVFKHKKAFKNDKFAIHYMKEIEQHNFKYAISIGRKYGTSVSRNLIKRRLRNTVLLLKDKIPTDLQFVIVVFPKANTLEFQSIYNQIENLLRKITE